MAAEQTTGAANGRGLLGILLLLVTTLFWGGGFVAQLWGASHLGPAAVICFRSVLAVFFLLGVQAVRRRNGFTRRTWAYGCICGVSLFVPMYAQQHAFDLGVTPGVCAFLTANYILLVPVIGAFVGRRASWVEWAALVPALVGTYFICVTGGDSFAVGQGELWSLACAALFAVEILVVDRFAPGIDTIAFSAVSFAVCALCALPFMIFMAESAQVTWANVSAAFPALLYLGLGSSGVGYTLQNVAQGMGTPPAPAAIVMSLESVFGVLFGWMFCQEVLSGRCLGGCLLVFVAVLAVALAPLCLSRKGES